MIILGGPAVTRGTTLAYIGKTPDGFDVMSFQMMISTLKHQAPRYLVIPIPGKVLHLWSSTSNNRFLIEMMDQSIDPDSKYIFKGYSGLINPQATEELEACFVNDVSGINTFVDQKWGMNGPISDLLRDMLFQLKPNWGYVVVNLGYYTKMLFKPLTIIYNAPLLHDNKRKSLLYFPGVQNSDSLGFYGSIPEVSAPVHRSLMIFTQDNDNGKEIDFSTPLTAGLFSNRVSYCMFSQQTMNGDFYFSNEKKFVIKSAFTPPLDMSKDTYLLDKRIK